MAEFAFDIYAPTDDPGILTGLVRLTVGDQLVDAGFHPVKDGYGDGFLVIHADNPDAQYLQKRNLVMCVRTDTDPEQEIFSWWIEEGEFTALSRQEQAGRTVRLEGPGALYILDRMVLGHSHYAPGQDHRGSFDVPDYWTWEDVPYGAILTRLLEEGQNHPEEPYEPITYTFNRNNDSNGDAWEDDLADYQTPIGSKGSKLLADFLRLGVVVQMGPRLVLDAYKDWAAFGTDRTSATFAAGKVRFEAGFNILSDLPKRIEASQARSFVLIRGRTGDYLTVDTDINGDPLPSVPYGDFLTSDTTGDPVNMERMGQYHLTRRLRSTDHCVIRHLIGPGGVNGTDGYSPGPDADYWLGDIVTVATGTAEHDYDETPIEVVGVSFLLQDGNWIAEAELGAQQLSVAEQRFEAIPAAIRNIRTIRLCQADAEVQQDIDIIGNIAVSGGTLDNSDLPDGVAEGDVFVVLLGNVGVAAIPAGGSPATLLGTGGTTNDGPGSDFGFRVAWRILTQADIDSGSFAFTDTERIVGAVYRNVTDVQALANTQVGSAGNVSSVFEVPPTTLTVTDGTSWVWAAGISNIDTSLPGITGLTARGAVAQGTEGGSQAYDSDGGVASWAGGSGALSPSSGWSGYALELVGSGIEFFRHAGRAELVGTSNEAKRCDDTEHWHETGSGSPTVTDDADAGFRVGTLWINDDGDAWFLTDNTAGAAVWVALATGGSGAPDDATYLVGAAHAGLTSEIVVGATPGGELGGTWASPTVDATHSGSAHHAQDHASRHAENGADEILAEGLGSAEMDTSKVLSPDGAGGVAFVAGGGGGAPTGADYLVGTAQGGLSAEIVVGTSPGGELGGTWASPTVDATHSGSTHDAATNTHIADTTDAHDASAISIADSGGYYTGTEVEAALQEVGADIDALSGGSGVSDTIKQVLAAFSQHYAGLYYDGSQTAAGFGTTLKGADLIHLTPIYIPFTGTYDRIAIEVTATGTATGARLGIYDSGSDGKPNALVLDAGTVTTGTTGSKEITISQSLTGDQIYWLAVVMNGTATLRTRGGGMSPVIGIPSAGGTVINTHFTDSFTYAALPNPIGALTDVTSLPVSIRIRKA